MKLNRLAAGLVLGLGMACAAFAQTTMKISISTAQNSHQGVAHRHLRQGSREAHQRPLQGPDLLQRLARRRARVDRGGAARHAGPGLHLHRPGAQLRARGQDPRHALPVPRQGPCARGARRPDRPGPADQVRRQGLQGAGLGRERLPPHDQQQARRQGTGRPQGPEDAHHGEPGAHRGLQGPSASSPRRWPSRKCSPRCSRARSTARRTRSR